MRHDPCHPGALSLLSLALALVLAPPGQAQELVIDGPLQPGFATSYIKLGPTDDELRTSVSDGTRVYVAGASASTDSSASFAPVHCYDMASGQLLWSARIDEPGRAEVVLDLELSANGLSLLACGHSATSDDSAEALFARLQTTTGQVDWLTRFEADFGETHSAVALARVPATGVVVATGSSVAEDDPSGGPGTEGAEGLFYLGLDESTGSVLWSVEERPSYADAWGVQVVASTMDSICYVGGRWGGFGQSPQASSFLRAVDSSNGSTVWTRYGLPGLGPNEGVRDLRLDPGGSWLYVSLNDLENHLARLSAQSGGSAWIAQLDSPVDQLELSPSGDSLYVETSDALEPTAYRLHSATGAVAWSDSLPVPGSARTAHDMQLSSDGTALYTLHSTTSFLGGGGTSYQLTQRQSSTGQASSQNDLGAFPNADTWTQLELSDDASRIVVSGTRQNGSHGDLLVRGYEGPAAQSLLWSDQQQPTAPVLVEQLSVCFGADGTAYKAGGAYDFHNQGFFAPASGVRYRALVTATHPDGVGDWEYAEAVSDESVLSQATLSADESLLFTAGHRTPLGASGRSGWLRCFDADSGALAWEWDWPSADGEWQTLQTLHLTQDGEQLLATAAKGNVQAGGLERWVFSFHAASGALQWERLLPPEQSANWTLWVLSSEALYLGGGANFGVGSWGDRVVALNLGQGTTRWVSEWQASAPNSFTLVGAELTQDEESLYLLDQGQTQGITGAPAFLVRELDAGSGESLQEQILPWSGSSCSLAGSALSQDSALLYISARSLDSNGAGYIHELRCIDTENWQTEWAQLESASTPYWQLVPQLSPNEGELYWTTSSEFNGDLSLPLLVRGFDATTGDPTLTVQFGAASTPCAYRHLQLDADGRRLYLAGNCSQPEGGRAQTSWELVLDSLRAQPDSISVAAGGVQSLELLAGPTHAGEHYLVLGSASGVAPGLDLGAAGVLPLAADAYFWSFFVDQGATPVQGAFGLLDAQGLGEAQVVVPPGSAPSLAGRSVHHAFLSLELGSPTLASNPVLLELTP